MSATAEAGAIGALDPRPLREMDPAVAASIDRELERQRTGLELIASENFVSRGVLEATGCVMTNKYAEGYPGRRYYGGCEFVDEVENLARERAWLNNRDVDFMIGDVFEISALLPAESFGLAIDRHVFRGIVGERERVWNSVQCWCTSKLFSSSRLLPSSGRSLCNLRKLRDISERLKAARSRQIALENR